MYGALIHVIRNEMQTSTMKRAKFDAAPLDPSEERPAAASRWPRKVLRALPISFAMFKRVVKTPLSQGNPKIGSEIVLPRRYERGRIEEVVMGVHTGATTYAIKDPFLPDNWVLLVPSDAVVEFNDTLELMDSSSAVAVPRELALAA